MPDLSSKKIKILIIRFSSIGDIILTTPVIRCLKLQIPGSEIHFLTKKKYLSLVEHNPHIDKIHSISKKITEVSGKLNAENYNLVVDLHRNLRTFQIKILLHRPTVTFRKLSLHKLLMVVLKINILPDIHIVDRMFVPLKRFGIVYDDQGLDFFLPEKTHFQDQINDFTCSFPDFFVFSIAGTYFTKRCPNEKVIEICRAIDIPVVLTGGDNELENGKSISEHLGKKCLNACGLTSVQESAALIEKSKFVISNDTGMMHIAAALRKPVISLWGNTFPRFGMTPYFPKNFKPLPAIIEVTGLRCRPCSKLGFQKCPKKHFDCMNKLNIEDIMKYLSENELI